jgi:hypothetical protein
MPSRGHRSEHYDAIDQTNDQKRDAFRNLDRSDYQRTCYPAIVCSRAKSHGPHVAISSFDCFIRRLEMKEAIECKKSSGLISPIDFP